MPLMLASARFDSTVKLGGVEKFRVHFFFLAGPVANNPNMLLVSASASFDCTNQGHE